MRGNFGAELFKDTVDNRPVQIFVFRADKQKFWCLSLREPAADLYVVTQGVDGFSVHQDEPLLVAFPIPDDALPFV